MKTDILFAIGGVDARFVEEALDYMYPSPAAKPAVRRAPAWRRAVRTALIAALIAAFLGATAYAVSAYIRLHVSAVGGDVNRVTGGIVVTIKDVGLTFDFEGLEASRNVGLKALWLPEEPTASTPYAPDCEWSGAICKDTADDPDDPRIPYRIEVRYPTPDVGFAFVGNAEIVREETRDNLTMMEIAADYRGTDYDHPGMESANFIMIFDAENGYTVLISSTMYGFDVLEKIAANLEIHVFTDTYDGFPPVPMGYIPIQPGRG